MIEINLLPESMRKAEATPLPRFIATCIGIIVLGSLGSFMAYFQYKVLPDLQKRRNDLAALVTKKEEEAKELAKWTKKKEDIERRVGNVKTLFRARTIWSKLLYDLEQVIIADNTLNDSNADKKYLWLSKIEFDANKRKLSLEGFASGDKPTEAMAVLSDFVKRLREFKPVERPEKEQIEALLETKKLLLADIQKRRQENENFDVVNSVQMKKAEELDKEISRLKDLRSGRIALQGFMSFFKPVRVDAVSYEWKDSGISLDETLKGAENLPGSAYKWKMDLEMKDLAAEEE